MKTPIFILLFILSILKGFSQSQNYKVIKELEGIWIAEDFYNSFDTTLSIIKSKKSFAPSDIVGLRINAKEIENGKINIGYSKLHDHLLRPEVSKFIIINGDTIPEQGFFEINLEEKTTSNFFKTSFTLENSNFTGKSPQLYWDFKTDTVITLIVYSADSHHEKKIRYKRINQHFQNNNQFPNPLYYYTRSKIIVGNYTLLDSTNNILSSNFVIDNNGKMKGYNPMENNIFHYSTDIYCGPESAYEFILICKLDENNKEIECDGYIYLRINENSIILLESSWVNSEEGEHLELGKIVYTLNRN